MEPPKRSGRASAGASPDGLRMAPDRMLDLARQAAELLVERLENLPEHEAWDGDFRTSLADRLVEEPPEEGRAAEAVIERAAREILPFATRLDHPRSFAFVPSSPTWPGVLADFMASGYHINACTWLVASGPGQLELVVIDWFRQWIGYPEAAGGLFTSGGSAATLNAFVAAREAAGNPERGVVYMSNQSHSVLDRAAMIIGIRRDRIRRLPADGRTGLDLDSLRDAIREDRAAGLHPLVICANAGAASTGTIDSLPEIAEFCAREKIWMHVDAAYGGFAAVTEVGKALLRGIGRADSIGLDAHKWFFQPYEAGCLLVKDAGTLETPFGLHHDVLQDTLWGKNHPNFADRGLQLSRSFRALKVWMTIQTFGMAALRQAIASGMELAARAEDHVRNSPDLELLNPALLGILCFRSRPRRAPDDEESLQTINRKVLARVFWGGDAIVSSTQADGKFSLRLCIINHTTTWEDVRSTLEAVERFGVEVAAETES